jgi:putative peptidoglycan lipid II flippase
MTQTSHRRQILRSIGIIMGAVLLSRLLGFGREWTVAHQIGSNATTDAYYAAFTLPDFLNYLVASASFEVIFIPVFTKYITEQREDEAWHVFSIVLTFMAVLMLALIVLGEIFAPRLVDIVAPGFNGAAKAHTVLLTRLILPGQFFLVLGMVMTAVQNARAKFLVASMSAAVYNTGIILGGWLLVPYFGIEGFAYGLLAGSFFGFFVLQVIGVCRVGGKYWPSLEITHPGFRLFIKLALPIMFALSIVVTDEWIIRYFGSFLQPASITWLTYGKALMRMPLAIVGSAVGVASFPFLARLHSSGQLQDFNDTLNHMVRGLLLVLLPTTALMIALSGPIVFFVFSQTRMTPADIRATAFALMLFSLGISAWGLQNLFSRGFYATRDTITPAVVGTFVALVSIPVYWYFCDRWNYLGLAAASTASIVAYTSVVAYLLVRRTKNSGIYELLWFSVRITGLSVLMGLACYFLSNWLATIVFWQSSVRSFGLLAAVGCFGLITFLGLAWLFRVEEVESYRRKIAHWFVARMQPTSPSTTALHER